MLMNLIGTLNGLLWGSVLIVALLGTGLYFTLKSGFLQFRMIKEMVILISGKRESSSNSDGISSFQAFCIGTATRVGAGNIAGVAVAIAAGGPGAIFWMWMVALLGATSAFVESTLSQVYKVKDSEGVYKGGPSYYMEKGLKMKGLGVAFALCCITAYGLIFNAVLSHEISASFQQAFGFNKLITTLVVMAIVAWAVFGGAKRIASITEKMVPAMAGIYILLAVFLIVTNLDAIPGIISLIIKNAFGIEQVIGGGMGAAISSGVARGLFSNEAGMGGGSIASAAATVSHPAKQGLVQTFGVFIDTLVICSATAVMVLISGDLYTEGLSGVQLVQASLAQQIGSFGEIFIAISMFLFAISTIFGCFYYGESSVTFIKDSKSSKNLYKLAGIGMVLFGGLAQSALVWNLADLTMGVMALINIVAILPLSKIAFKVFHDYKTQLAAGKNPVFDRSQFPELADISSWSPEEMKEFDDVETREAELELV
ncbi:sodium:alanine symporter [Propionigenium maris DSM 9537]|uniref:Sodium:alanine symporter n=1 Tax=Propionigenium maris DSM 9537 TaxID=1123000 RepID=A0A9W6LMR8_9FUSO|nr:sodium:alanine symporter family protein [Propionigenium maris]GLI56104.1 sodium:alanine symporter [Propionigenium maris DSM 9537]